MAWRTLLQILAITVTVAPVSLARPQGSADQSPAPPAEAANPGASPQDAGPRPARMEVLNDPYIPVPREARRTSPAVRWSRNGYVSVQVNVDENGDNIEGDAANEPSIAVDPTKPNWMAIGWRQFDTIDSDFRQAGWAYTRDGGRWWTFPGVIDPGVFRSDPVLESDADGIFYFDSLTNVGGYHCRVFKSIDGGESWDDGVSAYGGDKAWMAIDRTGGIGHGHIYAAWDHAGCCGDDWFNRSTDGGETFEYPIPIAEDPADRPIWGVTAVGPDGEVYVAGRRYTTASEFVVAKSTTAQDPSAEPDFDFVVEVELEGGLLYFVPSSPNPAGLLGQVWIAADHSDGPTRGNVYVLSSVDPSGSDPLDIHFIRSTDGGETWSDPVRVNDDPPGPTAWQWFGTMSVAPTGRIDAIWNDTRNAFPGTYYSALYYAYSEDAGETWSTSEAVSPPFDPHLGWPQQNKLGDYYDMVSDNVGAHVAYAATFNGEQDVYYLRIGDYDCNGNGIGDSIDIVEGTSLDCNANEIPDECEMIEAGDLDGDGDVDLPDYVAFEACFTGPCGAPPCDPPLYADPCCVLADDDQDGDLDLADFTAFQANFTGT